MSNIVLHDLNKQDIMLATQLLYGIEVKHAALIIELRDKPLDEIYKQILGLLPEHSEWSKS